jgi:hypothetical protein
MDLVKSEPRVSLMRIGGGCKEFAIRPYLERSVWYDDPDVKAARSELSEIWTKYQSFSGKVQSLLRARGDAIQLDCSNAFEAKQRKKNTYDAASTLLEAVAG